MRAWQRGIASAGLAIVALVACGASVAANAIVGSVLAVRGEVYIESAAASRPLAVNAPVHEGDAIVAGNGKVKIALDDGTVISVGENTRVRIGDHERASTTSRTRLTLVSGVLRLFIAKLTPDVNFEVETETAIAAVRGTDWVIEAVPERTSVAVLRGKVAVSGRNAERGTTVLLRAPGHGTDVRRGAAPTPPVPWGARRLADVLARATF